MHAASEYTTLICLYNLQSTKYQIRLPHCHFLPITFFSRWHDFRPPCCNMAAVTHYIMTRDMRASCNYITIMLLCCYYYYKL